MHSYLPYALPVLAAHIGIVWLIRRIMVRHGVHALVTTLLPIGLLFLSVAYEDIIWDQQICYLGSVFFALLAMDRLAPTDRPAPRQIVLAAVLCLLSVMSSNVGVGMMALVGVYAVLRHGIGQLSFLAVVPATAAFVWWYLSYGSVATGMCPAGPAPAWYIPLFAGSAFEHSLDGLGGFKFSAILAFSAAVLALGSFVSTGADRRRYAWPLASLCGTAVLYLEIAGARSCFGLGYARQPRYAYFAAVLLAPLVALGLDWLMTKWASATRVVGCLLLLGVALNFNGMRQAEREREIRTHAGALQLADAREDQVTHRRLPRVLSKVDPEVTPQELRLLVRQHSLHLPSPPVAAPVGDPGE